MTERERKRKLMIALSSYTTTKKDTVSLDEWFEVQDMKRNDPEFKKYYNKMIGKA